MKRLAIAFLAILSCVCAGSAQNPTPLPKTDDDVVRISTNLIQLDVVVTDSKGKIVRDLKPEEFEVYENGQKQPITNFAFVSNVREKVETPPQRDKIPVPQPPVEIRQDRVRRTIALVVDDLSLSFESAYHVRRALKKYVDEQMADGDFVAIIRTSAGVGALQQFTSNRAQLYAAIEKVKWYPLGRGNIGAFAPIEPTPLEELAAGGDTTVTEEDLEQERNFREGFDNFRDSAFAVGTLGALRYIVSGMSELPGRKSVILFSDGIRLFPRDTQGSADDRRIFDFMRQLIDMANRASVVFYTIDARGLVTTGLTAQDRVVSPSNDSITTAISNRNRELIETQEGLVFLARETGGFPVVNSNDISYGVSRVLDDQSYYLIGYVPDDDTFDSIKRKFNKLEVRVTRRDVTVRYRSGFINVASDSAPKPAVANNPVQSIQRALTSPFAVNDITLKLNTLFGYEPKTGTFVRSLLHVEARDLTFKDEPDGTKTAVFDILAVSFGDNGAAVDQIAKTYTLRARADVAEKIRREGFVYHFTFPIKKPGAYQFRVAIRDTSANRLGSASQFIEVPNLKKNRLTLSGIILENLTTVQWTNLQKSEPDPSVRASDPMTDTSTRVFKRGTVLRYGFEIYNSKLDGSKRPNLTSQIRVYRDRELVLDGKPQPVDLNGQDAFANIKASGAISLTGKMPVGDYVLQIIVYDNLAKEKTKIATQYVQFEVAE